MNKNLIKTVLSLAVLALILWGAYFVSVLSKNNDNYTKGGNIQNTEVPGEKSADTGKATDTYDDSDLPLATDFELTDLEGNKVKLSDYRGKIVFVNFWATWCPPCTKEMPEFNEANKVFEQNGDAVLLAVNLTTGGVRGETEDKVRKFMKDNGYTMKVLLDKTGKVADKYNIYSIPTTYVINKNGKIYTYYEGMINEKVLMGVYNELRK